MSNENKPNGDWRMPDPVFRSTEGRTPKNTRNYVDPDDIDTAAPDFTEADTDEFDTDPAPLSEDEIDTEIPDLAMVTDEKGNSEDPDESSAVEAPEPTVRVAETAPKTAGGCAKSILMMFGLTTLVVVAILAVLVYFVFFYTPANTAF